MLTEFRIIDTPAPQARTWAARAEARRAAMAAIAASWTLNDLNAVFGRKDMHIVWRDWRKEHGFPQPLPWARRPLRWNPEAVLRWKAAREAEAGSL